MKQTYDLEYYIKQYGIDDYEDIVNWYYDIIDMYYYNDNHDDDYDDSYNEGA